MEMECQRVLEVRAKSAAMIRRIDLSVLETDLLLARIAREEKARQTTSLLAWLASWFKA